MFIHVDGVSILKRVDVLNVFVFSAIGLQRNRVLDQRVAFASILVGLTNVVSDRLRGGHVHRQVHDLTLMRRDRLSRVSPSVQLHRCEFGHRVFRVVDRVHDLRQYR